MFDSSSRCCLVGWKLAQRVATAPLLCMDWQQQPQRDSCADQRSHRRAALSQSPNMTLPKAPGQFQDGPTNIHKHYGHKAQVKAMLGCGQTFSPSSRVSTLWKHQLLTSGAVLTSSKKHRMVVSGSRLHAFNAGWSFSWIVVAMLDHGNVKLYHKAYYSSLEDLSARPRSFSFDHAFLACELPWATKHWFGGCHFACYKVSKPAINAVGTTTDPKCHCDWLESSLPLSIVYARYLDVCRSQSSMHLKSSHWRAVFDFCTGHFTVGTEMTFHHRKLLP